MHEEISLIKQNDVDINALHQTEACSFDKLGW
jgi:hypothetical protein